MFKRTFCINHALLLGLCLATASACGKKEGGDKPAATKPAAKPAAVIVGSEIVAGTGKTSFRAGKVTKIEGTKLTFEYGSVNKKTKKKPTWTVDKSRAWLKGQVKSVKAGDHVVCRVSTTSWYSCKVEAVEGAVIKVVDSYGKKHNVALGALVKPDPATQANIKDYLIKEAKRRAFDKAFMAAGKPFQPANWKAKKGDKIVIHFMSTSWYGGTVVKNKKSCKWEGAAPPPARAKPPKHVSQHARARRHLSRKRGPQA